MHKTLLSSYAPLCGSDDRRHPLGRKKRLAAKPCFCCEEQLSITRVSIWALAAEP